MANPCDGLNDSVIQSVIYECTLFTYCGDVCELSNNPVCTDAPLVGNGTDNDCVRIENGGATGDCLSWDGTDWVIGPCPAQSHCTDFPIIGSGLTGDCIGLTAGTNCGQQLQWGATGANSPNAWSLVRPPGQTEVTIGSIADGALYPTVAAALADGCTFLRVITSLAEPGFTVNAATIIYVDPGITHSVTSQITINAELLFLGNSSQGSSNLSYATTTGVPFITGPAATNISFRHITINNISGAVANTVLVDPVLEIYLEDIVFNCANAIHTFLGNGVDAVTTVFTKLTIDGLQLGGGGAACTEAIDIPEFTNHVRADANRNGPIRISNVLLVNNLGWLNGAVILRSGNTLSTQEAVVRIIWENIQVQIPTSSFCILSGSVSNVKDDAVIGAGFASLEVYAPAYNLGFTEHGTIVSDINMSRSLVTLQSAPTVFNPLNRWAGVKASNLFCNQLRIVNVNHVVDNVNCRSTVTFINSFGTMLSNCRALSFNTTLYGGMMLSNIHLDSWTINILEVTGIDNVSIQIYNLFIDDALSVSIIVAEDVTLEFDGICCQAITALDAISVRIRIRMNNVVIRGQGFVLWSASQVNATNWEISWGAAPSVPAMGGGWVIANWDIEAPTGTNVGFTSPPAAQITDLRFIRDNSGGAIGNATVDTSNANINGLTTFGNLTLNIRSACNVTHVRCAGLFLNYLGAANTNLSDLIVAGANVNSGIVMATPSSGNTLKGFNIPLLAGSGPGVVLEGTNNNIIDNHFVFGSGALGGTGVRITGRQNILDGNVFTFNSAGGASGITISGDQNVFSNNVINVTPTFGGATTAAFTVQGENHILEGNNIVMQGAVGGARRAGDIAIGGTGHVFSDNHIQTDGEDFPAITFNGARNTISNNKFLANPGFIGVTGGDFTIEGVQHLFSGNYLERGPPTTPVITPFVGNIIVGGTGHHIEGNYFKINTGRTGTNIIDVTGASASFSNNRILTKGTTATSLPAINVTGLGNRFMANNIDNLTAALGIGGVNAGAAGTVYIGNYTAPFDISVTLGGAAETANIP